MRVRGRLERLERRDTTGGLPCRGCGWNGQILTVNEYVDAAGRTVRLEDWEGNQLPGWPDIPSCDLCRDRAVTFIVVRVPSAADGPAGSANHEP